MPETMLRPYRLETPEFTLRLYQPGDGEALREAVVGSYEHLRPWMPWASADQTTEEAEAVCRRLASQYLSNQDHTLGIWAGNTLLGGTGFHPRCGPVEWKCAEIGMWIRASESGKGLGGRVLNAMLVWGFGEWGWQRLVWKCDTANFASARVAEKCGMILEATHRSDSLNVEGKRTDTHLFIALASEWPSVLKH